MTQPKKIPYIKGPSKALKKERSFDLLLPALVTGCDARGISFTEKTKLSKISSQEAVIRIKIPKTIILEKNLNLTISGKVSSASMDSIKKERQLISLQLDKIFKIYPISKS